MNQIMNEEKKIELRSPKIRNMIGEIPAELTLWGYIFVAIAFVIACIFGYWFFIPNY